MLQYIALAGSDYTVTSMARTFSAGSSMGDMCINVPIIDDNIIENPETFTVTVTLMPNNVEVGQTTVTISDNEGI